MAELRPVVVSAPSALAEFWGWLGAQISSLVYNSKRAASASAVLPDIVLGRHYISIGTEVLPQEPEATEKALRHCGEKGRRGITIELARDAAILRSVADGPVPLVRAWKMAQHDVALNTPFDLADIHILFLKPDEEQQGNRYLVVKRSILDDIVGATRSSKHTISAIVFRSGLAQYAVRPEIVSQFNSRSPKTTLSGNRLMAMLAAAMIIVAGTNFYLAASSATAVVSSEIERHNADISGIRALLKKRDQQLNSIKAAYAARKEYVPFSKALEALTKAVPDGTYLTELSFRGKTLRISGYSDSAPKLISLLSQDGILDNPRFVSPVIKVTERGLDQFTIELAVKANG